MNQNTYVAKNCQRCEGSGNIELTFSNRANETVDCIACEGRGVVPVLQPPTPCPRCNRSGKGDGSCGVCRFCGGRGWALSKMNLEAVS